MSSLSFTSPSLSLQTHRLNALSSPPMSILRHLNLRTLPLSFPLRRHPSHRPFRSFTVSAAAAIKQDTTIWTPAPITTVNQAAESLYHISIDVSDSSDLILSHTKPGQYLQLKVPESDKPSFLAIASPPLISTSKGVFEFLVKSVEGSTAEILCGMKKGQVVELTQAMGNGFGMERIDPVDVYQTVLIFATGSGISPIRALIESGFGANKRSDVRLYYGARSLQRMAYQERFKEWESTGVKIIPVLSQPDDKWNGERGYVQNAFAKAQQNYNPSSTGVVLCGQKQMAEEVTSLVTAHGVSTDKILKNF